MSLPTLGMNLPAIAGITIQNNCKYQLEFCTSRSGDGYFFISSADRSFQGEGKTIQPGYTAGFVHTKTINSIFGATGNLIILLLLRGYKKSIYTEFNFSINT